MKNQSEIVIMHLIVILSQFFVVNNAFPQTDRSFAKSYRYKFKVGSPIIYDVSEKSIVSMEFKPSNRDNSTVMRIKQHVTFKLILMPESQTGGRTTLHISCKDIHANWDILGDTNRMLLSTSDTGEIQGTFNSKPTTLTDDRYSKEIEALYLHGAVVVNKLGKVESIKGNDIFESYWERWERLIPLVFPVSEINIGEKWHRNCPVGQNQGTKFPTKFSESLKMERIQNQNQNERSYSAFGLVGRGQDKTLKPKSTSSFQWLAPMEVRTTGGILFDDHRGIFVQSKTNHRAEGSYLQKSNNHSITVNVAMDRSIEMTCN